jgi:hypothetical protein
MKTVRDIIVEYLKTNGYDGLCYGDCRCDIDHIPASCRHLSQCIPTIKIKDYFVRETSVPVKEPK